MDVMALACLSDPYVLFQLLACLSDPESITPSIWNRVLTDGSRRRTGSNKSLGPHKLHNQLFVNKTICEQCQCSFKFLIFFQIIAFRVEVAYICRKDSKSIGPVLRVLTGNSSTINQTFITKIMAAFLDIEDEKAITDSETKIECIIGYPFGNQPL